MMKLVKMVSEMMGQAEMLDSYGGARYSTRV